MKQAQFVRTTLIAIAGCAALAQTEIAFTEGIWVKKVRDVGELISTMQTAGDSGVPVVIKLVAGTYRGSQSFASDYGPSELPPVHTNITIEGADSRTTILDAQDVSSRILTVLPHGQLVVRNVTITNGGWCDDENCRGFKYGGGGLGNFGGSVQIDHCTISGNDAGIYTVGGGVVNWTGSMRVSDTQIRNNFAYQGGGVAINAGEMTLDRTVVSDNRLYIGPGNGGYSYGGGVVISSDAVVKIESSTIARNKAGNTDDGWVAFGGGIFNGGTLRVAHSSIVENVSIEVGTGGGIDNRGNVSILDSTIGGNSAGTLGGGLYNTGTVVLKGVTLAGNSVGGGTADGFDGSHFPDGCDYRDADAGCYSGGGGVWNEPSGSVRVVASIIASNGGAGSDCHGVLTTEGHNILGSNTDCTVQRYAGIPSSWQIIDHINEDPLLGSLHQSSQAGSIYYPLLRNSPAIDQGGRVNTNCSATDQTGHTRVDGDSDGIAECDIGSTEYRAK